MAECSLVVVFVFTNGVVLRSNKNYTADGSLAAAVTDLRRRLRKIPAGQTAYVDLSPTVYHLCNVIPDQSIGMVVLALTSNTSGHSDRSG